MQKIRVSLSEEASDVLLSLMQKMGHQSPTHTANMIIVNMNKLLSPSEETNDKPEPRED